MDLFIELIKIYYEITKKSQDKPFKAQSIELEKSFNRKISHVMKSHNDIFSVHFSYMLNMCAQVQKILQTSCHNFSDENHFSYENFWKKCEDLFEISHVFLMIGWRKLFFWNYSALAMQDFTYFLLQLHLNTIVNAGFNICRFVLIQKWCLNLEM